MREVDLTEEKSAGIVVDESACLRPVRGNGAALLFLGVAIDADPEAAADGINFCGRRKRMSPDDILEQSDYARATLDRTGDPIGRLMVAMRIVSPADKKRSSADFPRAIDDGFDRALGLCALARNKAIGKPQEKHILRPQPKLRARLF